MEPIQDDEHALIKKMLEDEFLNIYQEQFQGDLKRNSFLADEGDVSYDSGSEPEPEEEDPWDENFQYFEDYFGNFFENGIRDIVSKPELLLDNGSEEVNDEEIIVDHLQDLIRKKYINEKSKKLDELSFNQKLDNMEYLMGPNSGYTALKLKTFNDFINPEHILIAEELEGLDKDESGCDEGPINPSALYM